ncbi:MAG: SoxR reducing system RseC family protein [Oscillospiraceae bacterium]|nr:SoxR reducing system RseC family protein [Oscillospiraceae bacterium]
MTQEASVVRLLPDNRAEVLVNRRSACGGNCSGCDGCSFTDQEFRVVAGNRAEARPGQRVLLETKTSLIFRFAFLTYILPILFLLLGYAVGALLHWPDMLCIAAGFLLLILSAFVMIRLFRRQKRTLITYEISDVIGE